MTARRAYAQGYGIALALDQVTDPPGGANAIKHGAEHEVKRAEIAGKTGLTGGPPTKKGTGNSSVKTGKLVPSSGTNWPSGDAGREKALIELSSPMAKGIIEKYDRRIISRTKCV